MAENVSYEQILREIAAKRQLKPWEIPMASNGAQPQAVPREMPVAQPPDTQSAPVTDPLLLAAEKSKINEGLAPYGNLANPETSGGGSKDNALMRLLMRLIR